MSTEKKIAMTPPSGFVSSEFTLVALVIAIIHPVIAYAMHQQGSRLGGYFALAGSVLCTVTYTIARMNIKAAWLTRAVDIAQALGRELEGAKDNGEGDDAPAEPTKP